MDKREIGIIIHLLLIVLGCIWAMILLSIVGDKEFHEHYNTPTAIIVGVMCTTASIHGIYLLITSRN